MNGGMKKNTSTGKPIVDDDDGFVEIPDDAIIGMVGNGTKVRPEDLLQPSDPKFRKVYPQAWRKIQEERSDEMSEARDKENEKDVRMSRVKKHLGISKNRYAYDTLMDKHPDLKD